MGTRYQTAARLTGVKDNIRLIAQHLPAGAQTALGVGCNEGLLICALAEIGLHATGVEAEEKYFRNAVAFGKDIPNVRFKNRRLSTSDVRAMAEFDVILLLSVHHQIAANSSMQGANEFLIELSKKARLAFFFQPATIASKYKMPVPFPDNDYEAVTSYFRDVIQSGNPQLADYKMVGFAANEIPPSEPRRPMMVFSPNPLEQHIDSDVERLIVSAERRTDLLSAREKRATASSPFLRRICRLLRP